MDLDRSVCTEENLSPSSEEWAADFDTMSSGAAGMIAGRDLSPILPRILLAASKCVNEITGPQILDLVSRFGLSQV